MAKIASTDFAFPIVFEVPIAATVATMSFEQIQPQTSINDKIGWIIHRSEWFIPKDVYDAFAAANATFSLESGIANSNSFSSPSAANPAIKIRQRKLFTSGGAAISTSSRLLDGGQPDVMDYSNLPGGGLLILPYPLFGYTYTQGTLPAALQGVNVYQKLFISQVQLSDTDFFAILTANQQLVSQ